MQTQCLHMLLDRSNVQPAVTVMITAAVTGYQHWQCQWAQTEINGQCCTSTTCVTQCGACWAYDATNCAQGHSSQINGGPEPCVASRNKPTLQHLLEHQTTHQAWRCECCYVEEAYACMSFGRYTAVADCRAATCVSVKVIAQLSGAKGSSTPNAVMGQLVMEVSCSLAGCWPCRSRLHQLDNAGSSEGGMQLFCCNGSPSAAAAAGLSPRYWLSCVANMLPPRLANRAEFMTAGLKVSLQATVQMPSASQPSGFRLLATAASTKLVARGPSDGVSVHKQLDKWKLYGSSA